MAIWAPLPTALWILRENGLASELDDRRRPLPEVECQFTGRLKDFQVEAAEAVWQRDFGVLAAPTGSGKTVIALALVAARRRPALIPGPGAPSSPRQGPSLGL